ncbi:MAG TPA: SMP-30/gluconolactonase/LRE family protein, partial [Blastocatellia bacterium]
MNSFQHLFLIAAALAVVLASFSSEPPAGDSSAESDSAAKIVSLDPAFDKLFPTGARVEKLVDGHEWTEGPVWNRKDGYLLFSDIPNNAIIQWRADKGESLFMQPA